KLSKLQKVIEDKGGKLIDNIYINKNHKVKIICSQNHEFFSSYDSLKYGDNWCATCSKKKKHTIETMKELAKQNKGKCLSDEYINNSTKLLWKCGKCNNEWYTVPKSVLKGHWCQKCQGK